LTKIDIFGCKALNNGEAQSTVPLIVSMTNRTLGVGNSSYMIIFDSTYGLHETAHARCQFPHKT